MISMYSRVRASGLPNGTPCQPSTTCGPEAPMPSRKRLFDKRLQGQRRHRRAGRRARRHLHDAGAGLDLLVRARIQAVGVTASVP